MVAMVFTVSGCGAGGTGLDLLSPASAPAKAKAPSIAVPPWQAIAQLSLPPAPVATASSSNSASSCLGSEVRTACVMSASYKTPRKPQAQQVNPIEDYVLERKKNLHALADRFIEKRLAVQSTNPIMIDEPTEVKVTYLGGYASSESEGWIYADITDVTTRVVKVTYDASSRSVSSPMSQWLTGEAYLPPPSDRNGGVHVHAQLTGLMPFTPYVYNFTAWDKNGQQLARSYPGGEFRTFKTVADRVVEIPQICGWLERSWAEVGRFSKENKYEYVPDGAQALDEQIETATLTNEYLDLIVSRGDDFRGALGLENAERVQTVHELRSDALVVSERWHSWHWRKELDLIKTNADIPIALMANMPSLELVISNIKGKAAKMQANASKMQGKVPSIEEALALAVAALADDLKKRYPAVWDARYQSFDGWRGWNGPATYTAATYLENKFLTDELAVRLISKIMLGVEPVSPLGFKVRKARDLATNLMFGWLQYRSSYLTAEDEWGRGVYMQNLYEYCPGFNDRAVDPNDGGKGKAEAITSFKVGMRGCPCCRPVAAKAAKYPLVGK